MATFRTWPFFVLFFPRAQHKATGTPGDNHTEEKTMNDIFSELVTKWPSAMVARPEVSRFSGGIISGKTLANLAARGEEVPPVVHVGRKAAYRASDLADWLRRRSGGKSHA